MLSADPLVVTQLVTLASTFLGFGFLILKRRWDVQDRKHADEKLARERVAEIAEIVERARAEAEALKIKTEAIAIGVRDEAARLAIGVREETRKSVEHIVEKVAEVKVEAQKAFVESNHANLKISQLNAHLIAQGKTIEAGGSDLKIDAIKETVDDIQSVVKSDHVASSQLDEINRTLASAAAERKTTQDDVKEIAEELAAGHEKIDIIDNTTTRIDATVNPRK